MKTKLKTKEDTYIRKKNDVSIGKSTKGITLIALVITIIVLLILAGVTIAMLAGENRNTNKCEQRKNGKCLCKSRGASKACIYECKNRNNDAKGK